MVKIRYAELPAGLHVHARRSRGDTIVYLLPGLTAAERRVALNRVRSSGLMGHGPRPSATSLLIADGVDRFRTVVGNGAAAMRGHPVLLVPSLVIMAGTFFAAVSLATMAVHQSGGTRALAAGMARPSTTGGAHPSSSSAPSGGKHAHVPGRHERAGKPDRRRAPRHEAPTPNLGSARDCVTSPLFGECGPQ